MLAATLACDGSPKSAGSSVVTSSSKPCPQKKNKATLSACDPHRFDQSANVRATLRIVGTSTCDRDPVASMKAPGDSSTSTVPSGARGFDKLGSQFAIAIAESGGGLSCP